MVDQKICLVGLPTGCSRVQLLQYMSKLFPKAKMHVSMKTKKSKKNHGWAILFVKDKKTFEAILNIGTFHLDGKNFFAKEFMEKEQLKSFKINFNKRKVFVRKIPLFVNKNEFIKIFEMFGELEDAYIVSARYRKLKTNYGFVIFKRIFDAERLINEGGVNYKGHRLLTDQFRGRQDDNQDYKKKFENKKLPFDRSKVKGNRGQGQGVMANLKLHSLAERYIPKKTLMPDYSAEGSRGVHAGDKVRHRSQHDDRFRERIDRNHTESILENDRRVLDLAEEHQAGGQNSQRIDHGSNLPNKNKGRFVPCIDFTVKEALSTASKAIMMYGDVAKNHTVDNLRVNKKENDGRGGIDNPTDGGDLGAERSHRI